MDLPNPARSRAVLIGVDRYQHLADLPGVHNNVRRLARLLRDPKVWGLPAEHCVELHNPEACEELLDKVHEAANAAEEAFVVYFAGHGLLSPNGDLHLALPKSDNERLYRAVPYDSLRHEMVDTCTALSRVVILDCCYSGRALKGYMNPAAEVADLAGVEGTYLMTASSETKLAWAPEGEEFTAFSGELVKALSEGIPGASDPLEMDSLFRHVSRELKAKGRPVPQQRARNAGHSIALTRNRWAVTATATPQERTDEPREDTGAQHRALQPTTSPDLSADWTRTYQAIDVAEDARPAVADGDDQRVAGQRRRREVEIVATVLVIFTAVVSAILMVLFKGS
ncbi:caspase domain-containing protein [Streptomyces sp. NPDC088246]|uniref:caspase family protein n=1 Tax=Streptomyces sp. NPDC088246 TaxID=3365842 RepID=UPI0038296866